MLGASRYDSQVAFNLCIAANDVVPGHLLGARQIRGLWEIQVKSSIARDRLLAKGITYNLSRIQLQYKDQFLSRNIPSEKLVFLGVPFFCNDNLILDYLSHHPNLTLRSSVTSGKIRNHRNELTDFLSGDRYVYRHPLKLMA